ncbi:hypothetical protein [Acetobacter pasteurianus]|uniref:hypothetical protein n=1 Tax=Acetobacter pasteurianus TaxID=438 RepID=UPI00216B28A9|nr:hypothetical protein [Acetobacter pasteurianus]
MDADEKGVSTIYTPGGPQEMNIINESGIWSLVLTSRMMMTMKNPLWLLPTVGISMLTEHHQ